MAEAPGPDTPPPPLPPPLPPPKEHMWLPLIGLVGVMLAVSFGGYVVAGEPREPAAAILPEPGDPVELTSGVTIRPLPGWRLATRFSAPADGFRLERGVITIDIYAVPFSSSSQRLFDMYAREYLRPEATLLQFSPEQQQLTTGRGFPLTRGSYLGSFEGAGDLEGEVSAVRIRGDVAAVADSYAAPGLLGPHLEDVRLMVDTLASGPAERSVPNYGAPYPVAEGVTIRPLEEWDAGETLTWPRKGRRLQRAPATLDLLVYPEGIDDALQHYTRAVLEVQSHNLRVSSEREEVISDSGLRAATFAYSGTFAEPGELEGKILAVQLEDADGETVSIVADVWTPPDELRPFVEQVHLMLDTLEAG